jgi:hypothetical protein
MVALQGNNVATDLPVKWQVSNTAFSSISDMPACFVYFVPKSGTPVTTHM